MKSVEFNDLRGSCRSTEEMISGGIIQTYYVVREIKFPLLLGVCSKEKVLKGLIRGVTVKGKQDRKNNNYKNISLAGNTSQKNRHQGAMRKRPKRCTSG